MTKNELKRYNMVLDQNRDCIRTAALLAKAQADLHKECVAKTMLESQLEQMRKVFERDRAAGAQRVEQLEAELHTTKMRLHQALTIAESSASAASVLISLLRDAGARIRYLETMNKDEARRSG
jgi:hypothetical protein